MTFSNADPLRIHESVQLTNGTMLLGFTGWMDGGEVSTGTVQRLVDLLEARPIAELEPSGFYLYNFPGSMEITALFRPHIHIEDGLIESIELPESRFYVDEESNLALFLGKEPNLAWHQYGDCLFRFAKSVGIKRILFVGSFGGSVPHTREPRVFVTCSEARLLEEMELYVRRRTAYSGPGSFSSFLMSQIPSTGLEMISLAVEIPGYLQGRNPMSIEAVTRRLAQILKLPLDLASLRAESTEWEMQVSSYVEEDEDMAAKVRELENAYDNELLEQSGEEE